MSLAVLLAAWQAQAIADLGRQPGSSMPVACVIRYDDAAADLSLLIEKRVTPTGIVTALAVTGAGVTDARLQTASVDSAQVLQPVATRATEQFRAEALLEDRDAGALLIRDLAVAGGQLTVSRNGTDSRHELPHPLPRDVTGGYLNCAGDLVQP